MGVKEAELEKRLRRKQSRKLATKAVPLWLDMLYVDFAHRVPLTTLDFTGYRLTDEVLQRVVQAPRVAPTLRCGGVAQSAGTRAPTAKITPLRAEVLLECCV